MWFGFAKRDPSAIAQARLDNLPSADHGEFWGKPGEDEIAVGDVGFAQPPAAGRPKVFIAKDRGAFSERHVPTDKLVAQQPTVVRSKVAGALTRSGGDIPDVHAAPDGRYYVEDGHHRISAALLRGQKTVKARVYGWSEDARGGLNQAN